jgi:hypothetical protein
MYLIYYKNCCKCHNVPPPNTTTTIIKKKEVENFFIRLCSPLGLSQSIVIGYVGFGFSKMKSKWVILPTSTKGGEVLTRPNVMAHYWVSNNLCQTEKFMLGSN